MVEPDLGLRGERVGLAKGSRSGLSCVAKEESWVTEMSSVLRAVANSLPHFAVRPEGIFHKIGGALGYQDIDFQAHPQFSQMYLLRGDDEPRIRELFGEERIAFFERHPKISVEGADNQLIFYRHRKRSRPAEVRQLMDEGFRVFKLFGESTGA